MINLKEQPFNLDDSGIDWVSKTLESMTMKEKVGQLFCPMGFSDDEAVLKHMIRDCHVGAMMYRQGPKAYIRETHARIQRLARIPLLLAANIESGGDGLLAEGTSMGNPMAVAASNRTEDAYRMGYVACAEGAAVGLNLAFAPIVDIDREFHNPITNVRTFGSNVETIIACATEYLRAADEHGVAVSIKHFPGDGVDERDQHLLTSINSLNTRDWDQCYGRIYQSLIARGAKTVMVGHIAQPAYVEQLNPVATNEQKLLPASLSKELVTGLLRKQLGFAGVVMTDATPMIGFTSAMPRKDALPQAVAAGCDIILFNKSLDEDYGFVMDGVKLGVISEERLDEAVTRILALKASLGIHVKQREGRLVPDEEHLAIVGCERFKGWAEEVADRAVTLVKDTRQLLPLSPERFKRVYLNVIQKDMSPEHPICQSWKQLFEREGFEVTLRDRTVSIEPKDFADMDNLIPQKKQLVYEMYRGIEEMKKSYDLYVYIANIENASNNTTTRLNWNVAFGLGDDAPWLAAEIPVLMISTANPYHLFDAPMIKTYINAYKTNPVFNEAIMEKIMGRSRFQGISPVDPYMNNPYLKMLDSQIS